MKKRETICLFVIFCLQTNALFDAIMQIVTHRDTRRNNSLATSIFELLITELESVERQTHLAPVFEPNKTGISSVCVCVCLKTELVRLLLL